MLRDLLLRLRSLSRRRVVEAELDDELRQHFERLVEAHLRQGLSHEAATRQARLEFGGFDQVKEAHRDVRGTARIESLLRDVAYVARQMRRAPSFALLAMGCLGLGIGVNTATFGVVNAVLLRPMPVAEPQRLVFIGRGQGDGFTYATYRALNDRSRVLAGVAATAPMESDLEVDGESEIAVAEVVSANYAGVMGVPLSLGRWFTTDDELSAVISDAVWDRKFQRRPDVIGRTIGSESQTYTIVGVAPPTYGGVFGPLRTDLWVPVRTRPRWWARLEEDVPVNMLMAFGRLRDGSTAAQATAELNAIDAQIATGAFASDRKPSPFVAEIVRGQPSRSGRAFARGLTTLLGAVVGVVLLIACANVGHLLLARGALRRRELAMRRALGASRSRLVQQLLVEAILLATGGAIAGAVLALWTNRVLQATFPATVAVFALHVDLSLDWRALAFTSAAALLAAVLSGLLPALRASEVRPDESFKGHVPGGSLRRRPIGLVAQVVMSLVLLFVGVSFLQGLDQLQKTAPGFAVAGRLYAHTAVPAADAEVEPRRQFYAEALERLRAIPGVERAALTSILPLIPSGADCVFATGGMRIDTTASEVGAGYFGTLGIPLIAGQEFSPDALTAAMPPVIVNETLARRAWPGGSAIGQRVDVGCDRPEPAVVAAVARDTSIRRIGEAPRPHLYRQLMRRAGGSFTTIVLATRADPAALTAAVRQTLVAMGRGVRVYEVQPLGVPVEQSYAAPRWLTGVLVVFGVLALALAAVGLFGITAHRVGQRTQEIGVRMALGARRVDVFREVMGEGLSTVVVGIAIGELLSLGLTGVAAWTLEGVSPTGPSTHVAVGVVWIAVAACACYLPSAWASRVDPVVALRHD
jgi:putative ABC transport system permease protein